MKHILLDILRRWWMLVIFFLLLAGAAPFSDILVPLPILGLFLLLIERKSGTFRAYLAQPVSHRDLAFVYWFLVVCLPQIINLPLMAGGLLLGSDSSYFASAFEKVSPWLFLAAAVLLGTGQAALLFLLSFKAPSSQPQTFGEWLLFLIFVTACGLSSITWIMLPFWLPRILSEMQPWHWGVMAAIPPLVWRSFQAAPSLIVKSSGYASGISRDGCKSESASQPSTSPGKGGLFTLIIGLHRKVFLLIFFIALIFFLLPGKAKLPAPDVSLWVSAPMMAYQQLSMYMLIFVCYLPDTFSLRQLRTLPLSSWTLTTALLSVPTGMSLLLTIYLAWRTGFNPDHAFILLALSVFIAGMGSAMLTAVCRIASLWRYALVVVPTGIMLLMSITQQAYPGWLLLTGCVLLPLSALVLQRGFWHASGYYQPRRGAAQGSQQTLGAG